MRVQIYRGKRGLLSRNQWRLRTVAGNGKVELVAAEGYNNLGDVMNLAGRYFPDCTPEVVK